MDNKQIETYNSHAKFMAEVGLELLNGNNRVLEVNGVKEIIALYLLIPYITDSTLQTPSSKCKIPYISGDFLDDISLEDLRNTISHSFVTVEELKNDGSDHGKYLIFDDRIVCKKKQHSLKGYHNSCHYIYTEPINRRLKELFDKIIKS